MKSNPLATETGASEENHKTRICQACGDAATLKTHNTGAPEIISGHYTNKCDSLNDFIRCFNTSPFGIVVPQVQSRVIWDFQTGGMMCRHPKIRGVYIPLSTPCAMKTDIELDEVGYEPESGFVNLMSVLASTNYKNNTGSEFDVGHLWDLIDRELPFTYKTSNHPLGYPETHEAWKWIKITQSRDDSTSFTNVEPLVNQKVVLVYPNSD